jgi:outer membrane protein
VGQAPGPLEPEPPLSGLPGTFEEALSVAEDNNPSLRAAKFAQTAAESRVSQARAAFRPSLSLRAAYGASDSFDADDTSVYDNYRDLDSASASATISIPIFTGGLNGSRVRQALERRNAAALDVEAARRDTLQRVSSSWAQLLSARAALAANNEQVRAARIAAEGVRQEAQVGLRTTLDVLNAETELREAELAQVRARRDEYVAGSLLLAAMGRLEAANLVEGVEAYDPEKNFNRVRLRGWTPLDPALRVVDGLGAPGSGGQAR